MFQEAQYFVVRCDRCHLIHPYEHTQCLRCGAAESQVVQAKRQEVIDAALQFLVPPQAVAMPREIALARQARQTAAPALSGRAEEWMLSVGERVAAIRTAFRPATGVAGVVANPPRPPVP